MPAKARSTILTTIRMNPVLYEKLKVIAAYNGRSINNEMEWNLLQAVNAFEAANGKIEIQKPEA